MSERKKGKPTKRRRRRSLPSAASPSIRPPLQGLDPASDPPPGRGAIAARVGLLGLGLAAFAALAWLFVLYPSERGPGNGHTVSVVVPRSPSAADLAAMLAGAGLLRSPALFRLWLRATGGVRGVVPGPHLLSDDASPRELVARLERRSGGGSARVTFPEGWNRFDMARRLQDKHVVGLREFLEATVDPGLLRELGIDGDSAEGFLFPATYELALDDDPRDVVRRMKHEFDRRWDLISRAHPAALTDVMVSGRLGVREIVTLASMVEKEAVVDEERPTIASVFLNRLREASFKPKHLECDPTASYGCIAMPERAASCAAFTGRATPAIEHDPDNPYSTYTHEGLPPGPIANPGARSLEAAVAPASTHYFFFVARGEGRHTFSETYEGHLAAIRNGGAPRPGDRADRSDRRGSANAASAASAASSGGSTNGGGGVGSGSAGGARLSSAGAGSDEAR